MTCKERYMQEHPGCDIDAVIYDCCPKDFDYAAKPDVCYLYNDDEDHTACYDCWNREIPGTENKKEKKNMCACLEFLACKNRVAELEAQLKRLNQINEDLANKLASEKGRVENLEGMVQTRTEEIVKLVAENNKLNERITVGKVRNDNLDTNLLVIREENKNLKAKIDLLTMQIKDYESVIVKHEATIEGKNKRISELCARIDKLDEAIYIEQDITMTKDLYELFRQARPIVIPKEGPTIRPINETPYVRYARHIRMKYKSLTDNGFSHDDAMALIPMWDDNEFMEFKRDGFRAALTLVDEIHEYKEN